jgi:hypothetical protein
MDIMSGMGAIRITEYYRRMMSDVTIGRGVCPGRLATTQSPQ